LAPRSSDVVFDECLRLSSPIRASARSLTEHLDVGGQRIPSGAVVVLFYAAANRDPARFPDPDRLDPTRVPGRHLAFGAGPHACAGNSLAVAAGGLVLERVARRCRLLRTEVTASSANWGGTASYVALRSLPVTYGPVPLRRVHQAAG
jgi:cytochrome P450